MKRFDLFARIGNRRCYRHRKLSPGTKDHTVIWLLAVFDVKRQNAVLRRRITVTRDRRSASTSHHTANWSPNIVRVAVVDRHVAET